MPGIRPTIIERWNQGAAVGYDIYSRLLKDRIIFVGGYEGAVTTDSANLLIAQLLYLEAEDPEKDFRPSAGTITSFHVPGGHGVRVDTHAYAGYVIPPYYDSMIAKLIVRDRTRSTAIGKMLRALDEFVIEGVATTIPFHRRVLADPDFVTGQFDTGFVERFLRRDVPPDETPRTIFCQRLPLCSSPF